jgi:putative FmdB family regulatory protein
MPIYEYLCDCGKSKDEHRSIAERNKCPICECGMTMQKVISTGYAVSDMAPYYDDNLETHIQSRQHRKQVMREKGVYESFGKNWYTAASAKRRA